MATVRSIEVAERRARLGVRHHLVMSRRTDDVVRITDDLVALHSTDPVTVYLSVTARLVNPSLAPLAAVLYNERTLARHHAMRRTLGAFTPEVARLVHAAATMGLVAQQQRTLMTLLEWGGTFEDPAAWLAQAQLHTLEPLRRSGPTLARQLGKAVPALATKLRVTDGKAHSADVAAHTRVLLLPGFEGAIVRMRPTGTWISGEYTRSAANEWIAGGLVGAEPVAAAAALAERWLRAFGPAPASGLQWWMGWNGRVTSAALAEAGAVAVDLDDTQAWVAAGDLELVPDAGPWVALLPSLDPTKMGWKQRDWFPRADANFEIFDRNGNGGATIRADGRVIGGWAQRAFGEIATRVLTDVGADQRRAIERATLDPQALRGDTRFRMGFPALMQHGLLAD